MLEQVTTLFHAATGFIDALLLALVLAYLAARGRKE